MQEILRLVQIFHKLGHNQNTKGSISDLLALPFKHKKDAVKYSQGNR